VELNRSLGLEAEVAEAGEGVTFAERVAVRERLDEMTAIVGAPVVDVVSGLKGNQNSDGTVDYYENVVVAAVAVVVAAAAAVQRENLDGELFADVDIPLSRDDDESNLMAARIDDHDVTNQRYVSVHCLVVDALLQHRYNVRVQVPDRKLYGH
jgi:hypothetical protein